MKNNSPAVKPMPQVMSHIEIDDLAEKRSDSVKRTVEMLVEQGVITSPQFVDTSKVGKDGKIYPVQAYMLNQRDSYVVMAQVNPYSRVKARYDYMQWQRPHTRHLKHKHET